MIHIEEHSFKPTARTLEDIERDDIVRRTLEEAERRRRDRSRLTTLHR